MSEPTIRHDDSAINGIPVLPPDKQWIVENHPQGTQVFATREEAEAYAGSEPEMNFGERVAAIEAKLDLVLYRLELMHWLLTGRDRPKSGVEENLR